MGSLDRNTVIGFIILAVLLFFYLFLASKNSRELQVIKQRELDSLAQVQRVYDSLRKLAEDTMMLSPVEGIDTAAAVMPLTEEFTYLENDLVKIRFTNKGGQPAGVELKHFISSYDSSVVKLSASDFDKFSYPINTDANQAAQVSELYFSGGEVVDNGNAQTISYTYTTPSGEKIVHRFTLEEGKYLIGWDIQMEGADKLLSQGNFNLIWQNRAIQHEKDLKYEKQMSTISYYEDNDFDYIQSKSGRTFEKQIGWVGVAQQFFNTTLIAPNGFTAGNVSWNKNMDDTSNIIANVTANFQTTVPVGATANIPLKIYYGPNDYAILKETAPEMDKIVNLGRDMYAFVRPINKYIVRPIFNFFSGFTGQMGIVIALLTIFIRLLTSPLVYSSYLSGARMKALRPELEKLREKYASDQQQLGMEQMKLYREAGVNPLGGCVPALLQIPIFFALYSFFNSNIDLRGQSFLWADDLSSYDVILKLPFYFWGLGDHLSLFTILAAGTSMMISLYNMNMTPDSGNPALKYMPYIFPVILLFIFNSLPSALTWYYTVSNLITLILQFIIQNYIIDHEKILAKIEENRKKPKTKSKWQERLEEIQRQQQAMQEASKGKKK